MGRITEIPSSGGLPGFRLTINSRCRRIIMRISEDGVLTVTAPPGTPDAEIRAAVSKHIDWIRQTSDQVAERIAARPEPVDGGGFMLSGETLPLRIIEGSRSSCVLSGDAVVLTVADPDDPALVSRQLNRFLCSCASDIFSASLARMYPLVQPLGAPFPELKIRRMKSRWGSCSTRDRVITMNLCLARAPLDLVDYVMLHELIHLVNRPHDARFHSISARLMPDYPERKKELNSLDLIY